MTKEEARNKANANRTLQGNKYKLETGETVKIGVVFPHEVSPGQWETYSELLIEGRPEDDGIIMIGNIDELVNYEKIS